MERLEPLRPELASVCRYLALKRAAGAAAAPAMARPPLKGILADLAAIRGMQ